MERNTQLRQALAQTKSKEEIDQFFNYQLSQSATDLLKGTAIEVFEKIPFKGFNCAVMNALRGAILQDHIDIPVSVIARSLINREKTIFQCIGPIPVPDKNMTIAEEWDGHCWLEFGGLIADIPSPTSLLHFQGMLKI